MSGNLEFFIIFTVVPRILIFFKIFTPNDKQIFEKGVIRSTLKLLRHVSVKSPSSGSALFELAKVIFVKSVN